MFVAEKWVDSVVKVERHNESFDTEDGLGQQFGECSYGTLLTRENPRKKNKIFGTNCSTW